MHLSTRRQCKIHCLTLADTIVLKQGKVKKMNTKQMKRNETKVTKPLIITTLILIIGIFKVGVAYSSRLVSANRFEYNSMNSKRKTDLYL